VQEPGAVVLAPGVLERVVRGLSALGRLAEGAVAVGGLELARFVGEGNRAVLGVGEQALSARVGRAGEGLVETEPGEEVGRARSRLLGDVRAVVEEARRLGADLLLDPAAEAVVGEGGRAGRAVDAGELAAGVEGVGALRVVCQVARGVVGEGATVLLCALVGPVVGRAGHRRGELGAREAPPHRRAPAEGVVKAGASTTPKHGSDGAQRVGLDR